MKFTLGLFLASMLQISASSARAKARKRERERFDNPGGRCGSPAKYVKTFLFARNARGVIMKAELAKKCEMQVTWAIHRLVLRRGIDGKDGSEAPRATRART